jgi:hypothetical protein
MFHVITVAPPVAFFACGLEWDIVQPIPFKAWSFWQCEHSACRVFGCEVATHIRRCLEQIWGVIPEPKNRAMKPCGHTRSNGQLDSKLQSSMDWENQKLTVSLGFEGLTGVTVRSAILWVLTPCRLVGIHRLPGGRHGLHCQHHCNVLLCPRFWHVPPKRLPKLHGFTT